MTAVTVLRRRLEGRRVRPSVVEHHGLARLFDQTDEEVIATLQAVTQDGSGGGAGLASWSEWYSGIDPSHARVLVDLWR